MIVCGRENAQITCCGDGGAILGNSVAYRGGVSRDCRLLHVVACFGPNQKPFAAKDGVNVCCGALHQVEKGTSVKIRLLEVEVDLGSKVLGRWGKVCRKFGFQAFGDLIVKLELGIQNVTRGPTLGQGDTWMARCGQYVSPLGYKGGL